MKSPLGRGVLLPPLLCIADGLVTTLVVTNLITRQAALLTSGQRLQGKPRLAAQLINNRLQARSTGTGLELAVFDRQSKNTEVLLPAPVTGRPALASVCISRLLPSRCSPLYHRRAHKP